MREVYLPKSSTAGQPPTVHVREKLSFVGREQIATFAPLHVADLAPDALGGGNDIEHVRYPLLCLGEYRGMAQSVGN